MKAEYPTISRVRKASEILGVKTYSGPKNVLIPKWLFLPGANSFPVRCRAQREETGPPEGRTKSLSQECRKVRVTATVRLPGPCFLAFWRNAQPSQSDDL